MKTVLTTLSLLFIVAGCSQSPAPADPSVITSRSDAWEEALNAGDIDALVALYTSDARLMPPNAEATTGLDGVRAAFGDMIDAGLGGELTSIEASVAGDIGYNVGTFTLKSGDDVVDQGKFVETWRRGEDGQWRIANDIFNSDLPAMAGGGDKTHMTIVHEVTDGEQWLAAWRGEDSRHQLFEANGAAHVHTLQSPDNPNLTGLIISVSDMEAIHALLSSEEGAAAAAADGVDLANITVLMEVE